MTFDEVKAGINKIVSNPDSAATEALSLIEEIESDYESLSSLSEERERLQAQIKDLQNTNIKLYLSQTSPIMEDEKTDEDKAKEMLNEFWKEDKK